MHSRRSLRALAVGAAFLACAPTLNHDAPATGNRPVFASDTGQIPLPTDLLKNATTGKMSLPTAPSDSPLTVEVKASINRLDGWLTAQTITIPFDAILDPSTLTYQNVLLYDVSRANESPPVVTQLTENDFYILFNVGRAPATAPPYNLTLKRKPKTPGELPAEFTAGGHYAAIVTDGVRPLGGAPFLDNLILYLLRARTPLAVAGKSMTILPDAAAVQLEATRAVYDAALSAIEANSSFNRDHALSFTVFSVESGARAVFNPTAVGTVLPTPFDNDAPANAAVDAKPTITFDQPIDASTAPSGTHLYKVEGATLTEVPASPNVGQSPDATGRYAFEIAPAAPLDKGTTYLAVLTDSIKGKNGVATEALSYFSLVRNKSPLVDASKRPPELNSPFLDNTLDVLILLHPDLATATAADWQGAYDVLVQNIQSLDDLRARDAPLFSTLENEKKIERLSITALWQFTTAN